MAHGMPTAGAARCCPHRHMQQRETHVMCGQKVYRLAGLFRDAVRKGSGRSEMIPGCPRRKDVTPKAAAQSDAFLNGPGPATERESWTSEASEAKPR